LIIDKNRALLRVVQTQNQTDQRGFPRSGETHQADTLAWLNAQIQILEHIYLRHVAETHAAKLDRTALHYQGFRLRRILDFVIAHNGMYTVGNIANVLEQIHEAPADIACLGNDQQRDADAHDEIRHADFAVAPQHQCKYQRADFQHQRRRVLKPHTALVGPQPAPRHANFVAQITIEVFA